MAKPNYAFAKRQRDLAKKQKKEEKKLRKAAIADEQPAEEGLPDDAGKPDEMSNSADTGQIAEQD
jgi:hypothetical protein